jgi:hypothetical protein
MDELLIVRQKLGQILNPDISFDFRGMNFGERISRFNSEKEKKLRIIGGSSKFIELDQRRIFLESLISIVNKVAHKGYSKRLPQEITELVDNSNYACQVE